MHANVNGPVAGNMNLGRPWGWQQTGGDASTVFVNNEVLTTRNEASGWLAWNAQETNNADGIGNNGNNPAKDSRYAEYDNTDRRTTRC